MKKEQPIKRVKLLIAVLTLALTGWHLYSEAGAYPAVQRASDRPEIVGMGATMAERLGADDNPGLVIHFSGDIHGGLEPCG